MTQGLVTTGPAVQQTCEFDGPDIDPQVSVGQSSVSSLEWLNES